MRNQTITEFFFDGLSVVCAARIDGGRKVPGDIASDSVTTSLTSAALDRADVMKGSAWSLLSPARLRLPA